MASIRALALGAGVVGLVALQDLAVAQSPIGATDPGFGVGLVAQFLATLVVNLLLGGALLVFGPRYANAMVTDIRDDPGGTFGWGLLVGIAAPVALVILAITIVGLIVAIPGLVVLFVLGLVGTAVTVAWIGTALTGPGDDVDWDAVGVGALALAVVGAIPMLGGFLTWLIGLFGLGVVSRNLYTSRTDGSDHESTRERRTVPRRDDV